MADLTTIPNDYHDARGERVYSLTILFPNEGMRKAMVAMVKRMAEPAAWTPFGHAGEPQDPPEPWPSDKTATWVGPPNCLDSGYALARCSYPNCNCPFDHPGIKGWCARGLATDEYPSGYRTNGEAMAQAQHEAAIDGDGCTAGACLLTRGAND